SHARGCAVRWAGSFRPFGLTFCAQTNQGFHLVPFPTTSPPLHGALAERSYHEPTEVQTAVLADEALGRDLLVSAQTGSGKTVAYGLAIASNLLDGVARFQAAGAPAAVIGAP